MRRSRRAAGGRRSAVGQSTRGRERRSGDYKRSLTDKRSTEMNLSRLAAHGCDEDGQPVPPAKLGRRGFHIQYHSFDVPGFPLRNEDAEPLSARLSLHVRQGRRLPIRSLILIGCSYDWGSAVHRVYFQKDLLNSVVAIAHPDRIVGMYSSLLRLSA